MLLDFILGSITLIVLSIATYTDVKTREVPDWLSYAFSLTILGIRLLFAADHNWNYLWSGLLGFGIFFLPGYILYKTNQWGGADSKLLLGLGAAIGVTLPFQQSSLNLFWFFLLLLLTGALLGLTWMLVMASKKLSETVHAIKILLGEWKSFHFLAAGVSGTFLVLTFLQILFLPFAVLPLAVFYLFLFITAVEKTCFYRRVLPEHITAGDWLAEPLHIAGKHVTRKKALEERDIFWLRKTHPQRKLLIKDGIPFVPSFLMASALFFLLTWQGKSVAIFLGLG